MAETLWDSLNNQKFLADRAYKDENGDNIVSTYAKKSEMSVTPGTGADVDKTTIELKNGLSATVLTAHQSLTGKADKVNGASAGNFAALDANGNLTDSGKTDTDFATSAQGAKADSSVQSVVLNGGSELKDASGNVDIPLATTSTDGIMSSADKDKLDNIEAGAQVNVQADWNVTDTTSDAYINNKPTIPTVNDATLSVKLGNDSPEVVFSANSDTAGMIEIPLAAYSDTEPAVYTDGLMTGEDKKILDQAVQVLDDAIMGVKVDGTLLTPDADNIVNIELSGKQDVLTAGTDLKIENNVISVNTNGQATGDKAFVAGESTKATGIASFAIGYMTSATGADAVAEGISTLAAGAYSHAEGENTKATAQAAHAEGSITSATGDFSHAEGDTTLAYGRAAHAEGAYTKAIWYAHAEGYNTSAAQFYSHAGGQNSLANGNHSFAHGFGVSAASDSMVAVGSYNETTANAAFVVGNGTQNAHSDAFIVGTDGTASATVLATSGIPDIEAAIEAITVPAASDANPQMDGTADAGSSNDYSRADHVHPSDTSKQDVLTFNTQYDPTTNKAATMSDIATELAPYAQTADVDQEFTETSAWANDTFYPLTSNPAGYLVQSDLADYATTGDLADLGDALNDDIDFVSAAVDAVSAVVPASANNGTLTINIGTSVTATFSADQDTNTTATIPLASFTADPGTSTTAYTEGLMTGEDKEKLSQIAPGAQVNVQSDWTESDSTSDAFIKNKPSELSLTAGNGIGIAESGNDIVISVTGNYADAAAVASDISFLSGAVGDKLDTTAFNDAMDSVQDTFDSVDYDIDYLSAAITGIPAQVQSDWEEVDNTLPSYIQNKPDELSLSAGNGIGITEANSAITISVTGNYATTTQLADKLDITAAAQTYYTTANPDNYETNVITAVKIGGTAMTVTNRAVDFDMIPTSADSSHPLVTTTDMAAAIADFGGFKVVQADQQGNPDESNPDTRTVYLVKNTAVTGDDKYKEWIWKAPDTTATPPTTSAWELIGDTSMDLNGYVQFPANYTAGHIVTFGTSSIVDSTYTTADVVNVQPDWEQTTTTAYDYIKNKPEQITLTGGSYIDITTANNQLTIDANITNISGAMSGYANVQPDWAQTITGADDYIKNKPDVLIPQIGAGVSAMPKYVMVVTAMPAATAIDPNTIYLVQGTYIGT